LRIRNYAEVDPTRGVPFSSKKLRECYVEGARRFGWTARNPVPGATRIGGDLVGVGMATAIMQTFRNAARARISINRQGEVWIESGTQEIGTGLTTVLPQIAADVLGVPVERVQLVLGDTDLPPAPMTAGSTSTLSTGSAVHNAARKLNAKLSELARGPLPEAVRFCDLLADNNLATLSADGAWAPQAGSNAFGEHQDWSMHSYGAVFAEVRIDAALKIPRLARAVGVYSAGRIINPRTARSQMVGGIIWGLGQALLEASEMDHKLGRYLSKNLAGYLVPVSADVPQIDVSFIEELDHHASPIGARGIGELGATGIGPASANAVFHASEVRVRELPFRPEMLLA
jgi:xanthine dehydrogenase YagR molybdenum-binding subunit